MALIQVTEQFVDIPKGKLFVKKWSSAESKGAPIVLLHDSLGCVELWKDFPQRLCETTGRDVIAYDRLGFGKSTARDERPSIRFINEEAEFYFPVIAKELNLTEFILFGHSVGGAMAVAIAGQYPQVTQAVITESAQAFVEQRTIDGITQAKKDFSDPTVFSKLARYHGEKTQWVLDAWIQVWLSSEFSAWNLQTDLQKMKCPVLAIHGENDEYGSAKFPETICQYAGGSSQLCLLENTGHVPHRENPERILKLVSEFL
ncbi:alpha/beta fold hydrolase [Bdellovibrio bacteriovorus]|uniref:alpha/beta fold hydrolase n=1 Tax=Bdellovibrio bacteriovorus TaxID=959 RepID=UPI0035A73458